MVSVIVLSKDRPAQLRLLLDSLDRNGRGLLLHPIVVAKGTSVDAAAADGAWVIPETDFHRDVRDALDHAGDHVCFMCDDGVLFRRPADPTRLLQRDPRILCHSLRLGSNTRWQYPTGLRQLYRGPVWRWRDAARDFGYPGSVDAHVFRTRDLRDVLDGLEFPNPTALECAMVIGCARLADAMPLMSCERWSSYVGVPVNRTSDQSGVRFGATWPAPLADCQARWDAGQKISLDELDFTRVDGAHTELELRWTADDRRAALHL